MSASIEVASGKAYCRGGCGTKIPQGAKCLKVHVYGAGGGATAFYCEKHMKVVLDSFAKAINDSEKDVEELET